MFVMRAGNPWYILVLRSGSPWYILVLRAVSPLKKKKLKRKLGLN